MLVWMYVAFAMYGKCSCMYVIVQSILIQHFIWMYMFMGLLAQMVNTMVPSSSLVKGLGTLHFRRLSFTIPTMYIPSIFWSFTAPVSVMCAITYGPSQCVFSFPGCLKKNLLAWERSIRIAALMDMTDEHAIEQRLSQLVHMEEECFVARYH